MAALMFRPTSSLALISSSSQNESRSSAFAGWCTTRRSVPCFLMPYTSSLASTVMFAAKFSAPSS
jgi:hypothetical protein